MSLFDAARVHALASWRADWAGLHVVIVGLGASGFAAADTLVELGARVTVVTNEPDPDRARVLSVLGVEVTVGPAVLGLLVELSPELMIVADDALPAVEVVEWADASGTPIWSIAELAWRVRDKVRTSDWIAITGAADGPLGVSVSRTATLAEAMLASAGRRVVAASDEYGVLDAVRDPLGFDALLVPLRPVDLAALPTEGLGALAPLASVCLEATEAVTTSPLGRVYANTAVACVFNRADAATMHLVEQADVQDGARAIGFGLDVPGPSDLGIVDGILCDRAFLDDRRHQALELITIDALAVVGLTEPASVAAVLAAAALARAAGAEVGAIHSALVNWAED